MTKVDKEKEEEQGNYSLAFKLVTTFAAVLTVAIAVLTFKLNSDDAENRRKKEETDTLNQSVTCSLNSCGIKQCVNIYTARYPKGEYVSIAIQASESGRDAPACTKAKQIEVSPKGKTYNQTNGTGSPIISGNGNSFTMDGSK